ncbi:MAG: ATP-binding protein [Polyangiaceae bacterium]
MKLIIRFALIYLLLSAFIFVLVAFSSAGREQARLEREAVADVRDLGYGLARALAITYEAGGPSATRRAVESITRHRSEVSISLAEDQAHAEQLGGSARVVRTSDALVVEVPVLANGRAAGLLELKRTLPNEQALFRMAIRSEIPGAFALSIAVSLVAILLGGAMIGRPLQRMVAHARRVGGGDYSARLRADRNDEIGDLKRELNHMCERLEASRVELAQESAARLATLEQLRHLDRLRTVGTIASSIAHELGTPLNVLLIRGQSLAAGKASQAEAARSGEVMVQQVEKMSRIVRRILDYARKDPSPQARQPLVGITRRSMQLLEGVASKAGVVFEGPEEFSGHVTVNLELFEQALTNVLMNAIHAMPEGGKLRVTLRREQQARAIDALQSFDACVVEVADTGIGIDPRDLSKLFEPFYTTKDAGKGTGLGLPVAKGIVEEHGGFIRVASRLQTGTTVSIYLPEAK